MSAMRVLPAILRGFALAASLAGVASADSFVEMQGWQPGAFQVICGDKQAPDLSGGQSCIKSDARTTIESMASTLLGDYRAERFMPPYRFGPVVQSPEGAAPSVRIYTSPDTQYANISPVSGQCAPSDRLVFTINPVAAGGLPKNVLTYIAAHELYHTIQGNFPTHMVPGRNGPHDCFPPMWIEEGIADAVSITRARAYSPAFFPPRPGQTAGFSWAGLRPYHVPIYSPGIPTVMQYRTSSFWRFLAEFYHKGRLNFLQDYALTPPPGDKRNEDWLAWLDDALQDDPWVATPLYLVYPGFLNHLAGDWVKGGDGENFGRSMWLRHAFGACIKVELAPADLYQEVEVPVYPMAGRCLSVTVSAIGEQDMVSVKVGILTDGEPEADTYHLGFAFTSDATGFNCARLARQGKIPPGIAGCLLEPATGTFENGKAARLWHASLQELGRAKEQRAAAGGQGFENLYVLARVPTKPRLGKLMRTGAQSVTLAVGLERATLSIGGETVSPGAAGGTAKQHRRRAAAALGNRPADTDMLVPAATGYVDMGPVEGMIGQGAVGLVGSVNEALGAANNMYSGIVGTGVIAFRLADVEVRPLGDQFDDEALEVVREFTVATPEQLPEGATGNFDAAVFGHNANDPMVVYISLPEEPAKLTILENSAGAFHASVRGTLCRFEIRTTPAAGGQKCSGRLSIEGSISKPFAYLYRTTSELISHQTEGEKLYNRFHTPRLAAGGLAGEAGGVGGSGTGPAAAGGGSSGGGLLSCDCGCPPRTGISAECSAQCATQWAMCVPQAKAKAAAPATPKPPTLEAQRKWFSRLVSGQGLAPEVEQMLVEDFATMSPETRAYLIRRYRDGLP